MICYMKFNLGMLRDSLYNTKYAEVYNNWSPIISFFRSIFNENYLDNGN